MSDVTGSATWRPAGHWQTHDGERLYTIAEVRERERAAFKAGTNYSPETFTNEELDQTWDWIVDAEALRLFPQEV